MLIIVHRLSPAAPTAPISTILPQTPNDDATQTAFQQQTSPDGLLTPDGRYRIVTDGERIGLWSATSGEFIAFIKQNSAPVDANSLHVSSDGEVLIGSGGSFIYAYNLAERTATGGVFLIDATLAAFSPDYKTLAIFRCESTSSHGQCTGPSLTIQNTVTGGQIVDNFDKDWLHIQSFTFSRDSRTVTGQGCTSYKYGMFALCGDVGDITWDVATGKRISS